VSRVARLVLLEDGEADAAEEEAPVAFAEGALWRTTARMPLELRHLHTRSGVCVADRTAVGPQIVFASAGGPFGGPEQSNLLEQNGGRLDASWTLIG